MRNLDIVLLVLLTPGILLVYEGRKVRRLTPTVPTNSVTKQSLDVPVAVAGNKGFSAKDFSGRANRFVAMQDAPPPPVAASTAQPKPRSN